MPDLPISSLPTASLPLAGTEMLVLVQGGVTKNAPASAFTGGTYLAGTGLQLTGSTFSIDTTVVTLTGAQTISNKTGNISMWTNDAGYLTAANAATTYVPYTGATSDLTLGTRLLKLTQTGPATGIIEILKSGFNTLTAPATQGIRMGASGVDTGSLMWVNQGGFTKTIRGVHASHRSYVLPDQDGTFAMLSDITGTIGGTIASTQVAVGSGVNTIAGSADYTWNGSLLTLNQATAPITSGFRVKGANQAIFSFENANGQIGLGIDPSGGYFQAGTPGLGCMMYNSAGTTYIGVDGSGNVNLKSNVNLINIFDGNNFSVGTTTGSSFGANTSQKISTYGVTPVVQATATVDLGVVLSNFGIRAAGTAYTITTSGAVAITGVYTGTLAIPTGSSLIRVGAHALTLTSTATSNATIPSGTGTLAYLAGANTWSGATTFSSTTNTILNNQNLQINTAGKGLVVKAGTNARIGTSTLGAGGAVIVVNTSVTANTKIFLQGIGLSNAGFLSYTISAGVSFTVTSSVAVDARNFDWFLVESN